MYLRPATIEDAALLLDWRNDPGTRQNSHNSQTVSMTEHVQWLINVLANPLRQEYIAEMQGVPVGRVRLDWTPDRTEAELSWTVAPSWRGQGIGKQMVALAVASAPLAVLRAEVKIHNKVSCRIAEKCGMTLDETKNGVCYYSRPFSRTTT